MLIDKYKTGRHLLEHEEYKDEDGVSWDGAEGWLQCKVLGFCTCGRPFENIKYVARILRHIHNLRELVWSDKINYSEWIEQGQRLGTDDALYFAYYVFDKLGLTEHGSSIPGWLTLKGIEFLKDAEELQDEDDR